MKKNFLILMLALTIFSVGCTSSNNVSLANNFSDESPEKSVEVNIEENTEESAEESAEGKINTESKEINKNEEIVEIEEIKETSPSELIDEKVNEVLGEYKDNVSIYFKNLNTHEEYMLNENEYYPSASTTKVALSMMILDEVNNGEKSLDDLIYFIEEDREGGTGILYYLDEIPALTIQEAIELSIVNSDNITKNMLRRIGNISVTDYTKYITGDNDIPYGNYTTAKQQGILLNRLYENPENNPYYDMLIEYMKKTDYHDRLDKYLSYDIVAHKIGNYYRYYHDIGIIYEENPYILVALTKDIGEVSVESMGDSDEERYVLDWGEKACELIAKLSKEIYTIVEENKM